MAPPKRPNGPAEHTRMSDYDARLRRTLIHRLCARARVVYGMTRFVDVLAFVQAQDEWEAKFPGYGAPGEKTIREVWKSLNPETVDLCANLDKEGVNRTAAEERRAAIERWRETVNRWYGIERELTVARDEAVATEATSKELRVLEERLANAQGQRLAAERELATATSVIDDESFDAPTLRSEVIAILARNRHHFTTEECSRLLAIFEVTEEQPERDPNVPDYMQ